MSKKDAKPKVEASAKPTTSEKDFVEIELDDGVYLFTELEMEVARGRTKRYKIDEKGEASPSSSNNTAEPEPEKPKKKKKPKTDIGFKGNEDTIEEMIYGINNNKNILVTGQTGCGKTTIVELLAKYFKKKLYTIVCDVEIDKSEVLGKHQIEDGKKMVWMDGLLTLAMKEGAWVLIDEVNMGKPEVFSSTHSVFDHRRSLLLKENKNEEIQAHPDFRIFGTMNPDYAGTIDMNKAFRRRWQLIKNIPYLEYDDEKELIIERTGINDIDADKLVKIGNDTRKMYAEGKLTSPVSTAHLLELAEMMVKTGMPAIDCAKITLNTTDDVAEQEDVLNVVRNYF